ncbi:hypothetical protein [Nocardiopsis tropica]|uniref:ATP/GTP-binding protein n=1 Tax=Nocardiopsis tropica TaxID=109330 RepID=A0ABU7KMX0_9ACTN|nr:hypothetical protein [Nocardiopsis umidischolae]MEE2050634.1 hypothetical protein [Nocardiopsis umidischolae]
MTHPDEQVTPPPTGRTSEARTHVARAELVLARDAHLALREVPLRPDPLQSIVSAVAAVRHDLGEHAEICLDLSPVTPARVAHLIGQAVQPGGGSGWLGRALSSAGHGLASLLTEVVDEVVPGTTAPRPPTPVPGADHAVPTGRSTKFVPGEPVFSVQILIRVESEIPGRAQAHLHQIMSALDTYAADNYWKASGLNLGFMHVGSDAWPWRRRFDERVASGRFAPRAENLVTAREIMGLLKPPTRHCHGQNVLRSGGLVPAPPTTLPTYQGQPDVLPLGYARMQDGTERLLGTPLDDLFFSFRTGKSRYGKTEVALVQAVALALSGHGVWFLDPHADGWRRAATMLTSPEVLSRLWEIDLTVRGTDAKVAGYNPLSMHGLGAEHIEDRVDAVVTAIASALSWSDTASRARTILTKACETLCHLGLLLPRQAQPTLFTIPRLLTDTEWRDPLLVFLPASLRRWWKNTFPRYPDEATPTVTNIIDRLAASPTLSAFFGSSHGAYDVRRAMDEGKVVFLCPPGGDVGRIVNCLLVYDLFRAGKSRGDVPPEQRRRYDVMVDELTAIDGASKGHLAAILEQLGKFGIRLHAMTQMAQRLSKHTRDALLQNQSLLSSTAGEVDAARVVTRQWANRVHPDTLVDLPRYHHVVSTTVAGETTQPFRVRGPLLDEIFAEHRHPDRLGLQQRAIDANLKRRRVGEVLEEMDTLETRIHLALDLPDPDLPQPNNGDDPGTGPTTRGSRSGVGGEDNTTSLTGSAELDQVSTAPVNEENFNKSGGKL